MNEVFKWKNIGYEGNKVRCKLNRWIELLKTESAFCNVTFPN